MTEVHEKSGRSERGRWRRRLAMLAAATMIAGIGVMLASVSSASAAASKWWVCKYVTTPGGDEVAQTVIPVDASSIPTSPNVQVGDTFTDAQFLSYVLKPVDNPADKPDVSECPPLTVTSVTPSVSTTPVTPATPATPTTPAAPAAPIPVAVAAGQHAAVSGTTVLLGTLLMVLGVGGVLTAWRPWKRGSH